MIFKVLTLFPEFFQSPLETGLLGKAVKNGLFRVEIIDIRSFAEDKYRCCDDYPYGGGSGMVLLPGPLSRALDSAVTESTKVVLTSAGGRQLDQELVKELAGLPEICLICGHYEGVDQRITDKYVDLEISIGDYVLSGGEYAALVLIDAAARLVPGFMSNSASITEESFEDSLLEYPQYTRPAEFDGRKVPEVLLHGNHALIQSWRLEQRIEKTRRVRPDLYRRYIKRKLMGE